MLCSWFKQVVKYFNFIYVNINLMKNLLLGIVFLLLHLSASSQDFGYDNPILPGMNPDPSI